MAEERRKKKSNLVVWAILALLVLALGGFGATGFGGSLSTLATVGDREISVQDYANAIQNEQNRLQQQTGQRLTIQQMQLFGLDRQVMERLLAGAALENEAERLGVSAGDAEVARRIRETPAFGGISGGFDREGYRQALRNAGLNESRYEAQVRDSIARELLQAAVVGGTEVPDTYADRIAAWIAETRDITLATITASDLPGGALAPTEADLQAFHDENPDLFMTPETRVITYAWVTPDRLIEDIEVDEEALRALYDSRADEFRQPARVIAERLAFADDTAAQAARDAIEAGEQTFDDIVAARGLTLDDVDQGEIAEADVSPEVAEALFALDEPGMAGPVPTPLGPALYRVNAILDPTEVTFDEARDDLTVEFAQDAARRRIDAARDDIDDLLAGGATLEELDDDTDMELGVIQWDGSPNATSVGIGAYQEFREVADTVEEGDFPELESLSDGGLFALRLDEIVAPALPPLDEIRDEVETAWQADNQRRRLLERAEEFAANPTQDAVGTPEILTGLTRDATLEGTPPALLTRVFEAEAGDVIAVEGDDQRAFVLRVDAVNDADLGTGEAADLRAQIVAETQGEIMADLFESYGQAVQARAGFSVDAQAVEAVQAQLGGGGAPH